MLTSFLIRSVKIRKRETHRVDGNEEGRSLTAAATASELRHPRPKAGHSSSGNLTCKYAHLWEINYIRPYDGGTTQVERRFRKL